MGTQSALSLEITTIPTEVAFIWPVPNLYFFFLAGLITYHMEKSELYVLKKKLSGGSDLLLFSDQLP